MPVNNFVIAGFVVTLSATGLVTAVKAEPVMLYPPCQQIKPPAVLKGQCPTIRIARAPKAFPAYTAPHEAAPAPKRIAPPVVALVTLAPAPTPAPAPAPAPAPVVTISPPVPMVVLAPMPPIPVVTVPPPPPKKKDHDCCCGDPDGHHHHDPDGGHPGHGDHDGGKGGHDGGHGGKGKK